MQYGFGQLSYTLLERGLLDELRLWVHPFFVGSGNLGDLLARKCPLTELALVGAKTLSSGVVVLSYNF